MACKIGLVILAVLLLGAAWVWSPWPAALAYRSLMDAGGMWLNAGLAKHVPKGVIAERDLAYAPGDDDALLDVYRPAGGVGTPLPAVVWVHGGGYLAGDKGLVENYLRIVAGHGYATVGVGYSLAPGTQYPRPIEQVAQALAYIQANAGRLGIDASRIVLAGDSAGAQIAAQVATVISSPDYAKRIGIAAPIVRDRLRGAILFCGLYDPDIQDNAAEFAGFLRTATWSYFGIEDLSGDPRKAQYSIVANLTAGFPPLFISAGNGDPLLAHSKKLGAVARAKGVPVDTLFFADDRKPALPHEYQFDLDASAGRQALTRTLAFLDRVARGSKGGPRVGAGQPLATTPVRIQ